MKYLLAFLLSFISAVAADIFPANRRASWVAGTDVGVQNGFQRFLPGGANERLTASGLNVANSPYSADRTGATDASTAINSAISAASSGQVVYLPAGIYKIESGVGALNKDNYTIRGDGLAYRIDTSAAATNPTWTKTGAASHMASTIAAFDY